MAIGEKNAVAMAVKSSVAGNLPVLTADGQLEDSGLTPSSAGVRPNLLLNPFFHINQRGKTTYNKAGYTLDMWNLNRTGLTVNVGPGLIDIAASDSLETTTELHQRVPYADLHPGQYTFSVLTSDYRLFSVTGEITDFTKQISFGTDSVSGFRAEVRKANKTDTGWFVVRLRATKSGGQISIRAAKLEFGATQTLARQTASGWELLEQTDPLELLKCQRYLLPLGDLCGLGLGSSTTRIWYTVPTPIKMRTTPVLQGTPLAVYPASESITINLWTVRALNAGNCVLIHADGTGITPNATYGFNGDGAFLSAEL